MYMIHQGVPDSSPPQPQPGTMVGRDRGDSCRQLQTDGHEMQPNTTAGIPEISSAISKKWTLLVRFAHEFHAIFICLSHSHH